jgi:glycosyltransferase involved in cell wall biosynthesis
MKIVLVHNQYQQPGGEDVVFDQERQLLENAGHQVVAYRRSNLEAAPYTGIGRLKLVPRMIWAEDTCTEFAKLVGAENPDIIHIHNTFHMISPSIYSVCRELRVPVVQTLHNYRWLCPAGTFFRSGKSCEECIDHSLLRSIRYGCYRDSRPATASVALMLAVHRGLHTWDKSVTYYIAPTEFARTKFLQAGFSAKKMFVKPNFIHPDPRPGDGDGNCALFAGRLSPEVRVDMLLNAWSRLRNVIPLVIIGDGPERPKLEEQVARLRLTNVTFQGHLPREKVIDAMHRARFLVFSSECYQTFALTIAESFACRIPVICSRMGVMQEIVEDGRTGLHFTPGSADDLAEKVDWAWDNPSRVRAMGQEARREYETKYTAERNYPLLMDIYNQAIAGKDETISGVSRDVRKGDLRKV